MKNMKLVSYAKAVARKFQTDWQTVRIDKPVLIGIEVLEDFPLGAIAGFIDWSPFFRVWELKGKYPAILKDEKCGATATRLFSSAKAMLDEIVSNKLLQANGVYGFWPAAADGDDIVLFSDESRGVELVRLHTLRQQWQRKRKEKKEFRALADFVAPIDSGREDYIGAFAVTTGIGVDKLVGQYQAVSDNFNVIMVKALSDRLAEAFAELLHQRARRDWGYGAGEKLANDDLIAEKYRGIRPAPGYPSQPDHSENRTIFKLLNVEANAGIRLTPKCMMVPAASVSGLFFAHPQARYFALGRITRDQVEDYARRKGMTTAEVELWLAPHLDYDASP